MGRTVGTKKGRAPKGAPGTTLLLLGLEQIRQRAVHVLPRVTLGDVLLCLTFSRVEFVHALLTRHACESFLPLCCLVNDALHDGKREKLTLSRPVVLR